MIPRDTVPGSCPSGFEITVTSSPSFMLSLEPQRSVAGGRPDTVSIATSLAESDAATEHRSCWPSLSSMRQPAASSSTCAAVTTYPSVTKNPVPLAISWPLDASGQLMASGTGFFVTEGYVVTAAHVLEDAAGCRIELSDGQQLRCSVAASDSAKDVAMLTVSGRPPATLRWGSSESMKDGDEVTVISNPLGQLPGTVSRGIISASRVVKGTKLLQISAAISHGSSGAPVLNSRGQVIGIVRSTIEAGQSLNFATATDAIRNLNNDQGAVAEGQVLLTTKTIARGSMDSVASLP